MRNCPKLIDRPISILGLEIDEICFLMPIFYFSLVVFNPMIAILGVIFGWVLFLRIKKGKPQGAIIHFLYKLGVPFKGLIKPVKKGYKFSIFRDK